MQVTVTKTNQKTKRILTEAATFFANLLMDPRMVRNLTLDIEVNKSLDVEGECVDEDGTKSPRWFTIVLRKQGLEDMIKVLGHEMVHVKQHAKNELSSGRLVVARGGLKFDTKWKGELWLPKKKEDPYFDSPWELEALGMEFGLFHKWQTRYDQSNPWAIK